MKIKIRTKLLLFLMLLILPSVGRLIWYHRGWYTPPTIPEIDGSKIAAVSSDYQPFKDEPSEGNGRVIIDLSHANRLEVNDLNPLQDRLKARGATVETFDGTDGSLNAQLHDASALVVIAPRKEFTDTKELDAIVDFVEDGGRLLLAADPTRPARDEGLDIEDGWLIFIPRLSAVPAANSLANVFGVSYFDDYLYNLNDNEGNYRNVRFRDFSDEHPLTEGLEMVVFFAPHSLRSDGLSLVIGDENTYSRIRTGEIGLAAATLTADGRVLALGDITFLTTPYHTIGDNDRFLSNIADWLAVDERQRDDLEDFPHLFKQPVDLVQVSGDLLDPRLTARSSELQELFDQAGLSLNLSLLAPELVMRDGEFQRFSDQADLTLGLRGALTPGHDALLVGTFARLDLAMQNYLTATAGITITMLASGGEKVTLLDDMQQETPEAPLSSVLPPPEIDAVYQGAIGLGEMVEGVLTEDESHAWTFDDGPATIDIVVTTDENDVVLELYDPDGVLLWSEDSSPFVEERSGVEIADEAIYTIVVRGHEGSGGSYLLSVTESAPVLEDEEEEMEEENQGPQGIIEIGESRTFGIEGTTLIITDRSDDRLIVTVLAENGEMVLEALDRLISNNLSNCVRSDMVYVCSTGELQDGVGMDASFSYEGSIFILSDDDGSDGKRTGATAFESILNTSYNVTVWSTSYDGIPTSSDLDGYEAYIIDSGDYAFDDIDDSEIFYALTQIENSRLMFVGAQPLPSFGDDYESINDLEIADASYPLAAGFASDMVISLLASESGVPALVISDVDWEEVKVVFTRGPDSPETGAPALIAATDVDENVKRMIVAAFAFYRLPEDAQRTFALNAAEWLMEH